MGQPAAFTNLFVFQCCYIRSGLNNLYSCVYESMSSLSSIHIVYWHTLETIYRSIFVKNQVFFRFSNLVFIFKMYCFWLLLFLIIDVIASPLSEETQAAFGKC